MGNISTNLLLLIGILFILQMITGIYDGIVTSMFIFVPSLAFEEPWRFITSMFLHGGIMHLFFNAYALFLFGSILESRISSRDFLTIFFIGGLVGGLAYYSTYLAGMIGNIPALGASGAIYAILGAVAVILPNMRIFVWFFPMRMWQAAIFWVIVEFLGSFDISSGIASAAHLGGLLFGLAYAYYLKNKEKEYAFNPHEFSQEPPW